MADTILMEKKLSTNNVEKVTDELADTLLMEKNVQQKMLKRLLMNWQM